MNKKPFYKKISIFILVVMMAGCIPMSEASIDKKAASVAEKVIKESEKPKKEKKVTNKRNKKLNLAEDQVLNLSGRYFYDVDPDSAYGEAMTLLNVVFPGLTRQETETGEFLPVLAKSWEISDDLLTWTFTLRDDIAWVTYNATTQQVEQVLDLDGKPAYVTAADIQTRMLYILDPYAYSFNSSLLYSIVGAEEYDSYNGSKSDVQIEVPSSTTLVVHLKEPDAGFLALTELTVFSAFPSWLDPFSSVNENDFYGPFIPTSPLTTSTESISVVKNPYWIETEGLGTPFLDEVHFDMQYNPDVLEAFKTGELDVVLLTNDEYQLALNDPELSGNLVSTPGSYGNYLFFNNTDLNPLNDVATRKLLASAIDKSALFMNGNLGSSTVLEGFIPDFLKEEPFSGIPFNAAAKSTTVTYLDFLYYDYNSTLAEGITAQLIDHLGWNIYSYEESYGYLSSDLQEIYTSNPGIYLMGFSLNTNDPQSLWHYLEDQDSFVEFINGNWNNTKFNELLEQAKTEMDREKRDALYAQMEEILVNEDVMVIPLLWAQNNWLVRSDVAAEILPVYQQLENWARIIP